MKNEKRRAKRRERKLMQELEYASSAILRIIAAAHVIRNYHEYYANNPRVHVSIVDRNIYRRACMDIDEATNLIRRGYDAQVRSNSGVGD